MSIITRNSMLLKHMHNDRSGKGDVSNRKAGYPLESLMSIPLS